MVALGALAKGRSPSRLINDKLLSQFLPQVIAADHYPGYMYGPSRFLPADDPSRGLPIRAPSSVMPHWLIDLAQGNYSGIDYMTALPYQTKEASSWARFVIQLAAQRRWLIIPQLDSWTQDEHASLCGTPCI